MIVQSECSLSTGLKTAKQFEKLYFQYLTGSVNTCFVEICFVPCNQIQFFPKLVGECHILVAFVTIIVVIPLGYYKTAISKPG